MEHTFIQNLNPEKQWEYAIVMQGPFHEVTHLCIEQTLLRQPEGLLILCTYAPAETLLNVFEKSAIQAGRLVVVLISIPTQEQDPHFWNTNVRNSNLQRLSSYVGIQFAQDRRIPFSVKIRQDTFLGRTDILDTLRHKVEKEFPVLPRTSKIKGRLVISGHLTILCYEKCHKWHIQDQFFFGHTSDLLSYFNMSDSSVWRTKKDPPYMIPEGKFATTWMQEEDLTADSPTELIARYFIVENPEDLHQIWTRIIDFQEYLRSGSSYIKRRCEETEPEFRRTTNAAWLKLL